MGHRLFFLTALMLLFCPAAWTAPPQPLRWPALKEQLAGVRPGSALEKLIQANQDFGMLQPGEPADGLDVPLWLRVWWRKAHPEVAFPPEAPLTGYPRVLNEIHEWMMLHQDLRPDPPRPPTVPYAWTEEPAAADAEGLDVMSLAEAAMAWGTSVGTNQNVSGAQPNRRSESDIRIDVRRVQNVIAASNNIGGSRQAQYYSRDGGATWSQVLLPLVTGDTLHSDPTVDWSSDGTAWTTTLGISGSTVRIRVYKSTDGGATWTYDGVASGTQSATDKQMARVGFVPAVNYLHVIWHNSGPVYVNRKLLPSGSWGTPLLLSGAETSGRTIGADLVTLDNGHVYTFWPSENNRRILMRRSLDNGATYAAANIAVASTYAAYEFPVPAFANRKPFVFPSAGAFKTVDNDFVYVAWTDLTGASGCTSNANAPGTNVLSTCKSRIWFSRSLDGGATWSTPVMINNQASLNDQFNQKLIVDPNVGLISIAYYDTVDDPGRKKADLWMQQSYDDGATWAPAVKVTSASTDETVAGADLDNQYGDYNGMASFAGKILPTWTDRRSGGNEQVWTAPVTDVCEPCGNPFSFVNPGDQSLSCYAQATLNAGYCSGITDANDRFLCNAMAARSDAPCASITDHDLYWACRGMSVDAGYGTCINLYDPDMTYFCYDVSRNTTVFGYCDYLSNPDTKNLCYAMAGANSSFCANIVHAYTRNFCYGVTTGNTSYCAAIQ